MIADPNAPSPLAAGQIEIWKKIVDVQQHFNDLELRVRNFALILTGAFLGLGGYAIKDADMINAFGFTVSVSGLVVFSAIVPLFAFYFMDRLWYHRLLDGSVQAGIDAEAAQKQLGYKVDLGSKSLQTVRKLQDLGIEWRKERAGRNFGRFRPIGRLMRPERAPSRARMSRTASGRDGGGHRLGAEDV